MIGGTRTWHLFMLRNPTQPYHVVAYTSCPYCGHGSLGLRKDGKIVRHSVGFGSVEKVGPGTRHPNLITRICEGSLKRVG